MNVTKYRLIGLSAIELPIRGARLSDPFVFRGVDGLTSRGVDVNIADSTVLGGVYQGRRPQALVPAFKIGLNPDWSAGQTISSLREKLYGLFTPGLADKIVIEIYEGTTKTAFLEGQVSNFENDPSNPDQVVQVTVQGLTRYLQAAADVALTTSAPTPALQVNNLGTAPTGFYAEVVFAQAPTGAWTIYNENQSKWMTFNYAFQIGDVLKFDTRPGSRFIALVRNGVVVNLLRALTADSTWLSLFGGTNTFTFSGTGIGFTQFRFTPQYWGV